MAESPRASRQRLISQVEAGALNPHQAELEAERLGIPKLEVRPNLSVLSMDHWSPVMAAAWIAWNNTEVVVMFDDDYRRQCSDWFLEGRKTEAARWTMLEGRPPISLIELLNGAYARPEEERWFNDLPHPRFPLKEAASMLKATGAEDRLTGATARALANGLGAARRRIEAWEWADFEWAEDEKGRDALLDPSAGPQGDIRQIALWDIKLTPQEIVTLWADPARTTVSDTATSSPPALSDLSDEGLTATELLIRAAIRQLWPKGMPVRAKLPVGMRNEQILTQMRSDGFQKKELSPKSFERYFAKTRRE